MHCSVGVHAFEDDQLCRKHGIIESHGIISMFGAKKSFVIWKSFCKGHYSGQIIMQLIKLQLMKFVKLGNYKLFEFLVSIIEIETTKKNQAIC